MSKINIIDTIKQCIFTIIEEEYKNYLKSNNILLIEESKLLEIVTEFYTSNVKNIKSKIRETLKENYSEDYKSGLVENILLDIFQEKSINIMKIVSELTIIQNKNLTQFTLPLINNSLNLNISLVENYVIINSVNPKNIAQHNELYESISKYKFLYSINNILLHNYCNEEKINIIKKTVSTSINEVTIQCYYLKKFNL
jgi:hypothetical protein